MQRNNPSSKPGQPDHLSSTPAPNLRKAPGDWFSRETQELQQYMDLLDHPLKQEAQALREIILNLHPGITEDLQWDSPCFHYKGYMVTFNLRSRHCVQLIFHYGAILDDQDGFLQGDSPSRRMAYFHDMQEVQDRQPVLQKVIREWVQRMDTSQAQWEAKASRDH